MTRINFFGSITDDVVLGGYVQGGAVSYGGVAAINLGKTDVRIFSHGPYPHPYFDYLQERGIDVVSVNAQNESNFTRFGNEYVGTQRYQLCPFSLPPLTLEDFAKADIPLPENEICVLAPVMNEIPPELVSALHRHGNKLFGTIQGFLRVVDDQNRVSQRESQALMDMADKFHTIIFSEEDIAGLSPEYVELLIRKVKTAIITDAENGTTIITRDGLEEGAEPVRFKVPAYKLTESESDFITVDTPEAAAMRKAAFTGLGDTFAAAYISSIADGGSIRYSAVYASIVASLKIRKVSVEGGTGGIEGCPTTERIRAMLTKDRAEGRLREYLIQAGVSPEGQRRMQERV
jgi:sugar/nucleoside kinase (ribokinase family)